MVEFIAGEHLDGDPYVTVFEVTDNFVTVSSHNYLSASWLQWIHDNGYTFINTWRSDVWHDEWRIKAVMTNFKKN